jgi:hypothetical protein
MIHFDMMKQNASKDKYERSGAFLEICGALAASRTSCPFFFPFLIKLHLERNVERSCELSV